MRSSTGHHWIALDHVRALAAFLVFTWHFLHNYTGVPVPFRGAPVIAPLAILDEGHAGVSLFMTLSGYLFAKLLDGKRIRYAAFFWNRLLRLAPLMLVVLIASDMLRAAHGEGDAIWPYLYELVGGFGGANTHLPNGIWSIVIETRFYLILPLLMLATRRNRFAPLVFLAFAITLRMILWAQGGDTQFIAYWTIFGRIDQFLLGIFAFQHRALIRGRIGIAATIAIAFLGAYYAFDAAGGYESIADQPFGRALWLVWPTIEGASFASLIAYYDASHTPRATGLSGLIGKAGEYSYSIYLLHFFVVYQAAYLIDRYVMNLSNFYVACLWSALCFAAMVPIGRMSFVLIEAPFLRLRMRYAMPLEPDLPGVASASAGPVIA